MRADIPHQCPYPECPGGSTGASLGPRIRRSVRRGSYYRAEDSRWIPRYRCLSCLRSFGSSRFTQCFGQKKRRINHRIDRLLCSGVSQRRIALLLRINRKTVVRKFRLLAEQARAERGEQMRRWREQGRTFHSLQFDEMESFEHSKCKPLSIPLLVEPQSRKILAFAVAVMPASGPLAEISRKKYGPRADERAAVAHALLRQWTALVPSPVKITTDQNPRYPGWLKAHFPALEHTAVKGARGCIVGQGELKKLRFDPLFSLNHTAAMIRANVSRLFRRTWNTTKRRERLLDHLELYAQFHNRVLT